MNAMKSLFLVLPLLFAAGLRAAAAESGDTVCVRARGAESPDVVDRRADRWDFSVLPFSKKKNTKYELRSGGIYFGFVTAPGAPAGLDVDMGASYEIGADLFEIATLSKNHRHNLSVGFGLDWRNYRMTGRTRFVREDDGAIGIGPYPEGADIRFSRLKVFSLTFPLRYVYGLSRHVSVNAAAILCLNTYGSLKTRYRLEGQKQREFDRHIRQRPVSLDLQAGISWKSIGLYVKGSPFDVLHKEYGPGFKPLSVGVDISF